MFFFFKQKTAYEMRISDWSSDVCSSDLNRPEMGPRLRGDTGLKNRNPSFPFASSEVEMPISCARLRGVSTSLDTNGGREGGPPSRPHIRHRDRRVRRSEERRVGKEWVRTCRSRGVPGH